MSSAWRVLKFSRKYLGALILSGILMLVYTTSNILFLPVVRDMVSELGHRNFMYFNNHILNAVCLFSMRIGAQYLQLYVSTKTSYALTLDIRMAVYEKLIYSPQQFFSEWKLGDSLTRLFEDTDHMRKGLVSVFVDIVPNIMTFIGVLIYLLMLNWKLTALTLAMVPLVLVIVGKMSGRMEKITKLLQRKRSNLNHFVYEVLSHLMLVQAYTMEKEEKKRFITESMRNFKSAMNRVKVRVLWEPISVYTQFAVIVAVVWFGGHEMVRGHLDAATLTAFFTGIFLLADPVMAVSLAVNGISQSMASAKRVFQLLDAPITVEHATTGAVPPDIKGQVTFDRVSFKYQSDGPFVLEEVSLTVQPGETIALVGRSGAGKSTLLHLISRFYDPVSGAILVDGMDIKQWDIRQFRSYLSLVPQEDLLFRGSVLENVRYAKPSASLEAVETALKKAQAWDFVAAMPDGMMSNIGDRGSLLSGGQKQRLSIARAILKDPKILLLDEATSALDSQNEALIQEALRELVKGRTTFVIAHRLSTIQDASRIVVFDGGKIVQVGRHEELVGMEGGYGMLYREYRRG